MEYVIVGRIRKPQGIRGQVTVEILTDTPDAVFAPGSRVFAGTVDGEIARNPATPRDPESRQELVVETSDPFKGGLMVKFAQIRDRTESELWRHRYLLVPMDEVEMPEEGDVFVHELPGMTVRRSADGADLGEVIATYELPLGLAMEVAMKVGDNVLVPYRPDIVLDVDREAKVVVVDGDCGLFD